MLGKGSSIYRTWEPLGNVEAPSPTPPEATSKQNPDDPQARQSGEALPQDSKGPAHWWPSTSHGVPFSFFLSSKIVPLRAQHPPSQGHPFLLLPNTLPRPKRTSQHRCPCFYEEATSHAPPDLRGSSGTVLIPKAMDPFLFPVAELPLLHYPALRFHPSLLSTQVHPLFPI